MKSIPMFAQMFTMMFTLTLPTVSLASDIGHYRATLKSDNVLGRNGWNNLGLALLGWSCSGSESIEFSELLTDHKGHPKRVPQNIDSEFKSSLFDLGEPTISEFNRDMNVPDAKLTMTLTESCTKISGHWETTTGSDGELETEYVTDILTAWMKWECDTRQLPQRAGEEIRSQCTPSTSYFGDFGLESILVSIYRQKTFTLTLGLKSVQESYSRDFCRGKKDNRVIISLKQGVGGHVGENDFVFHVTIDGKTKFDIKNESGILNDEVAYCGGNDLVTVEVDATEEDVFFDDQYVSRDAVVFNRDSGSKHKDLRSQTIELKRKTYLGELFTDKSSSVVVGIREGS